MRICFVLALGLLSACEISDSQRVVSACTTICGCIEAPLPAIQDRCISDCSEDVSGELTDDCLACISAHDTCTTLERDCDPLCNPPEPPIFADANR